MWVYIQSERNVFTVGHGNASGDFRDWHTDSDHATREEAANRCAYLNGARSAPAADNTDADRLADIIRETLPATTGQRDTDRAWRNGCASACERIARHVGELLRPTYTGAELAAWFKRTETGAE